MPTMTEFQFIVGCIVGSGIGISLSRNGIMVSNPETRWKFVGIMFAVAGIWGLICGLINQA